MIDYSLSNPTLAQFFDYSYDTVIHLVSSCRFLHTLGSVQSATVLARLHRCDPAIAGCAAFWHDCTKGMSPEQIEQQLHQRHCELSEEDRPFPRIWHALLSAVIAKEDHGLDDPDAFRAIYLHPTGDAEMTPLAKIIFLSDYTEPMRDFEGVDRLRALAREDLDRAMGAAVRRKIRHIRNKGRAIHPRALRALDKYGALAPEEEGDW